MTLGHTVSLQRCWRFQLALCPVPQCPSASAPPLPSPNHQGGPFRAMQLECDPVVVVVVGGVWVERSRWVVVWFPQQVFPKLGGNGEGQQGLSCLSLRHEGGGEDSLCLGKENDKPSIQEALDPQTGAQIARGSVCTVSQCGHLPGVWH